MFIKLLALSLIGLTASSLTTINAKTNDAPTFNSEFNLVTEQDGIYIESVKNEYKSAQELRIYGNNFVDAHIVGIKSNAFDGCTSLTSLMVTSDIQHINADSLTGATSLETIFLTKETTNFPVPSILENYDVYEYACNEGFENYWKLNVRAKDTDNLCEKVTKESYPALVNRYNALALTGDYDFIKDRIENKTAGTTYGQAMDILESHYGDQKKPSQKDINKAGVLTFILIVASFGMTAIGIFYFLKDKRIIS